MDLFFRININTHICDSLWWSCCFVLYCIMLIPRYTSFIMERIADDDTERRFSREVEPSHNSHSCNNNVNTNIHRNSHGINNKLNNHNIDNHTSETEPSHISTNIDSQCQNHSQNNRHNSEAEPCNNNNINNSHTNNHSSEVEPWNSSNNNNRNQQTADSPKSTNNNNEHSSQSSESDGEDNDDAKSNCGNSPSKHHPPQCKTRERIGEQYYCLAMDELRLYEQFLAQLLLATLKRVGVCVLQNFLPTTLAESVHGEMAGIFNTAVEETKLTKGDLKYRTDEVSWVGANDAKYKSIHKLSHTFRRLIISMGRLNELRPHRFKITHQSHSQVSRFPKGCSVGYKPHVENPNKNGRLLSVAYFTNKDYTRIPDNGQVRFYLNDNTKYVEVEPSYNTAVIYWSDRRVIKEVLPSDTKDLFHITSWFFGSCAMK